MNKIYKVTTEPGVITQVLREAVAEKGLFYPVDQTGIGSCFIGGNIAEKFRWCRALKWCYQRLCLKFRSSFTNRRYHLDRCEYLEKFDWLQFTN